VRGYASYKVADSVKSHQAWGLGVYSVFHAAPVVLETAIETPQTPGVGIHHVITRRLNRKTGSGIAHIWNQKGDAVIDQDTARLK
jgi:hypothetical protein